VYIYFYLIVNFYIDNQGRVSFTEGIVLYLRTRDRLDIRIIYQTIFISDLEDYFQNTITHLAYFLIYYNNLYTRIDSCIIGFQL
jgi:hypothetical protein